MATDARRLYTYTVSAVGFAETFDELMAEAFDYIADQGSEVVSVHYAMAAEQDEDEDRRGKERLILQMRYSAMILVRTKEPRGATTGAT